ncbi:MAG: nitroreductase family protein, partial [Dehalococcoidales bacterium]|nr:nitroreductase family protein [Dehalococcoidales bacterium]
TELGLGTCWIGWFDEAKAKKVLGITGSKKIEILLSVGYPAEDAIITPQRRKPLKDISEYNHGSSH